MNRRKGKRRERTRIRDNNNKPKEKRGHDTKRLAASASDNYFAKNKPFPETYLSPRKTFHQQNRFLHNPARSAEVVAAAAAGGTAVVMQGCEKEKYFYQDHKKKELTKEVTAQNSKEKAENIQKRKMAQQDFLSLRAEERGSKDFFRRFAQKKGVHSFFSAKSDKSYRKLFFAKKRSPKTFLGEIVK